MPQLRAQGPQASKHAANVSRRGKRVQAGSEHLGSECKLERVAAVAAGGKEVGCVDCTLCRA